MEFDPYSAWLGITTPRRPPTHYELLGLHQLEANPEIINAAVARCTAAVKAHRTGAHKEAASQVLGDLFRATACLTDRRRKFEYDRHLRNPAVAEVVLPPVGLGPRLSSVGAIDDVSRLEKAAELAACSPPLLPLSALSECSPPLPPAENPLHPSVVPPMLRTGGDSNPWTKSWRDEAQKTEPASAKRDWLFLVSLALGGLSSLVLMICLPLVVSRHLVQSRAPSESPTDDIRTPSARAEVADSRPQNPAQVEVPAPKPTTPETSRVPVADKELPIVPSSLPVVPSIAPGADPAPNTVEVRPPIPAGTELGPLGLVKHFNPPELKDSSKRGDRLSLGTPKAATGELTFALLEPSFATSAPCRFRIQQNAAQPAVWQLALERASLSGARTSTPVATCEQDKNGQLIFAWALGAEQLADADQLRNCVLQLEAGGAKQRIACRSPLVRGPLIVDIEQERMELPLDSPALPPAESFIVEILGHNGLPDDATIVPASAKKKSDPLKLVLRNIVPRVELRFESIGHDRGRSLRIVPLMVDDDTELPFTIAQLEELRTGLNKEIARDKANLAAFSDEARELEENLIAAQSIENEALRQRTMTGIKNRLQYVSQRAPALQKKLAKLQRIELAIPGLQAICNQVHRSASVSLRVSYLVGDEPVDVLRLE